MKILVLCTLCNRMECSITRQIEIHTQTADCEARFSDIRYVWDHWSGIDKQEECLEY